MELASRQDSRAGGLAWIRLLPGVTRAALFERYLKAVGYDITAYKPDLGIAKRPDYLIRAAGQEVVVEVPELAHNHGFALGSPA